MKRALRVAAIKHLKMVHEACPEENASGLAFMLAISRAQVYRLAKEAGITIYKKEVPNVSNDNRPVTVTRDSRGLTRTRASSGHFVRGSSTQRKPHSVDPDFAGGK